MEHAITQLNRALSDIYWRKRLLSFLWGLEIRRLHWNLFQRCSPFLFRIRSFASFSFKDWPAFFSLRLRAGESLCIKHASERFLIIKRLFFFPPTNLSFFQLKGIKYERMETCVSRIGIQTGGSDSFENAMPNEAFASCRALSCTRWPVSFSRKIYRQFSVRISRALKARFLTPR